MSIPDRLQRIVDLFASAPTQVKLEALLDYSDRLPSLPPELEGHREHMEQVHECVTPFFLATEVAADGTTRMWFDAPRQAPTTRGYAGIVAAGLDGEPADVILDVPDLFYLDLGLGEVVTPQRLRGMGAIMHRLKRQIRDQVGASPD